MEYAGVGERYEIQGGTFEVGPGYVETRYDDGTLARGDAHFDEEQRARAIALGYPEGDEGVWEMHKEHELLHSVVAEAMGRPHSAALFGWQSGTNKPGEIPDEERIVFLLQRALNDGRAILAERKLS